MSTVAVLALGLLSLANTVLLLGIARRLAVRTPDPGPPEPDPEPRPVPGTKVREFTAVTTDGEPIGRDRLNGRTLAGFFAQGCPMCEESVTAFARLAEAHDGGREQVLAVVVGRPETAASYVDRLAGVARVLTEPFDGPICAAFDVDGFPAFLRLAGPVVLAATVKIEAFTAQHAGRG
jgi:peroxiredoxin